MLKTNSKFRILITTMVLGLVSIFSITNVNAAYAYSWIVDGESLSRGSSNKSGNVSWVEDNNYNGGILVLNNYNGGQLKIDCYGTELGHSFAIKLVGDNKITVKNGVGIIANAPIVFIGDGKLSIEASVPIGSGSIVNSDNTLTDIDSTKWNTETTMTIEPTKNSDNNETSNEIKENNNNPETNELTTNNDEDNKKVKSENNNIFSSNYLINVIILSYCVISLIIIIILTIKLNSSKKSF